MISGLDLARLRRLGPMYMPDTVSVFARTASRSSSGGTIYTTATTATRTSAGRLTPMSERLETYYADKLGGRQGWTITLPEDSITATVPLTAVLKVGSRAFEVIGSDRGRSYRLTRRYDCVEVTV